MDADYRGRWQASLNDLREPRRDAIFDDPDHLDETVTEVAEVRGRQRKVPEEHLHLIVDLASAHTITMLGEFDDDAYRRDL